MDRYIRLKHIKIIIILLKLLIILFFIYRIYPIFNWSDLKDKKIFFFILAGFFAQLIDGALGMAYGVSCSTILIYFGVTPKISTAAVHTAEIFTTGISGLSHLFMKNVDLKLLIRLVIPGVIGSAFGSYLISNVFDAKIIKPYISIYLLILGLIILYKSFGFKPKEKVVLKNIEILAILGGFFDAIGGGGWGPIVTSNIVNQGKCPKKAIGTVNTTEFFIAFISTGIFLFFVGAKSFKIVLGLGIGGMAGAPIGAYVIRYIKPKILMLLVGITIILTQIYNITNSINFLFVEFLKKIFYLIF